MATEILLNGLSSYKQPVTVTSLKKVNIFYGLNGTGKTTVSQFLAANGKSVDRFKACKLTLSAGKADPEFLVYNQDFVQANFLATNNLKGIFTLDQKNVNAEKAITAAKKEAKRLDDMKPGIQQLSNTYSQQENADRAQLKENIWQEKLKYENTNIKICLDGFMGSKEAFLNHIFKITPFAIPHEEIADAISKIESELGELSDKESEERQLLPVIKRDLTVTELDVIFSEKIFGAQDSYFTDVIEKLAHADWINDGVKNYLVKTDDCPFCARHLGDELKERMLAHLDTVYQQKQNHIAELYNTYLGYQTLISQITKSYKDHPNLSSNSKLLLLIDLLEGYLTSNLEAIALKIKEPSQEIKLTSTLETITLIDLIIDEQNLEIVKFNQKLKNRRKSISELVSKFWQLLKTKHEQELSNYQQRKNDRHNRTDKSIKDLKEIDELIKVQHKIIIDNQKATKNVDTAIKRINDRLTSFGLMGFKIQRINPEKDDHYLYHIVRDSGESDGTFKTLSEGEKTLISFLYFIEECVGVADPSNTGEAHNRIIAIDDPISSLSFNLVYDISILIKDIFLNQKLPYRQVFLFTHHLYFLHELLGVKPYGIPDEWSLYRVSKNVSSSITSLKRDEIQNNYDNYWKILKEVAEQQAPKVILPNIMRNILEQYFSFVHDKDNLSSVLKAMSTENNDLSFKSFERYINRESHSDSSNFIDANEIDINKYLQFFRAVFDKSGHLKHYIAMFGEQQIPAVNGEILKAA